MIPMNEIGQNLHGLLIAAGRGSYIYDESGKTGKFEFLNSKYFVWKVSDETLDEMELESEDLEDCIDQIEKDIKDIEDFKLLNNMPTEGGYKNVGAVWRSKKNPAIICVFTPTDLSTRYANWDGYFEWYYQDQPVIDKDKTVDFMKEFDKMIGDKVMDNTLTSPILIPSYYEAVDLLDANFLGESRKDLFLGKLWNYHKGLFNKAFREDERKSILKEWKEINHELSEKKNTCIIEQVLAEAELEESKKKSK